MSTTRKWVILLGDGMPDEPIDSLNGKTPLMAARTPNMDRMAKEGSVGQAKTTPDGYSPGSDVTNMGILGYDPRKYYTGRAPLEAASMGISLGPNDVAYRCNLVTLAPIAEGVVMEDFSSGHIETAEASQLVAALNEEVGSGSEFRFYPGVSYRHLMIWRDGIEKIKTTPPHDISGQNILEFMPKGDGAEKLRLLMGQTQMALKHHPVNKKRKADKKPEANSIWLWGQGKAPTLPKLKDFRGITGAMISAVDLMKGIGVLAGMEVINVQGATGYIDTNYEGKANAAINALRDKDLVYIHIEAPDESSHSGSMENKLRSIEDFDAKVVGPLMREMERIGGRAMVLSDHPCPLSIRTHSRGNVPFAIWPSVGGIGTDGGFNESILGLGGAMNFDEGWKLFERFISP